MNSQFDVLLQPFFLFSPVTDLSVSIVAQSSGNTCEGASHNLIFKKTAITVPETEIDTKIDAFRRILPEKSVRSIISRIASPF